MGQTPEVRGLPDAAGRRPRGRLAVRSALKRFTRSEAGATAIEYGLIVALIFLVIISGVQLFASKSTSMYEKISTAVGSVM